MRRAPRIVAAPEGRVMITKGDRTYARGSEAPLAEAATDREGRSGACPSLAEFQALPGRQRECGGRAPWLRVRAAAHDLVRGALLVDGPGSPAPVV